MLVSSYEPLLVVLSICVAVMVCFTALNMAGRVVTARGRAAFWWLASGALVMGLGIWSMHFVGMLSFKLPIALGYDVPIMIGSLVIAMISSGFALWLVSRRELPWRRLAGGALLMGAGIRYDPVALALSVVIGVLASAVALWITFRLRHESRHVHGLRAGAAVVMGGAISGMHYTGMAAAGFPLGSICQAASMGLEAEWIGLVTTVATLAVLVVSLYVAWQDLSSVEDSLAQANEELAYQAMHDNLTKLPNRRLLEDRLGQMISEARREKRRFALMFMDLDGFKVINDGYGHHAGDLLLVEIARRMARRMRGQDTLSRLGGDEFVMLGYVAGAADARALADALREVVREPFQVGEHELRISASIGIAVYPDDGPGWGELLTNADAAMYHAKRQGRDACCFFEPSMNAEARQQLELAQELHQALEQGQFLLHYQPKFLAPDGPIVGAEALVRWQHPVRGLVSADQFIPLAERVGLVVPLGIWALEEVCRQMARWRSEGLAPWSVALNISAQQLVHAGLIDAVRGALGRHRLDAACLTLEITESTVMHDVAASLRILGQLNDMGVRISIDDFGTGYSSLLHLKRLPASELKIDQGFVSDLPHDPEGKAIVSAIVALGKALNMQLVAEGVETAEQQAFLTQIGCHALQGHLLARAMTAEALGRRWAQEPWSAADMGAY